jgi:hypothetical protein
MLTLGKINVQLKKPSGQHFIPRSLLSAFDSLVIIIPPRAYSKRIVNGLKRSW